MSIFIVLIGVAMFAYVMGNFADRITGMHNLMGVGNERELKLQSWIELLKLFSKGRIADGSLIPDITKHFDYYWENDRNKTISKDDEYMVVLPNHLKYKVMAFLWGDIFTHFWYFFSYVKPFSQKFFEFYYEVSFLLMPRR